MPKTKASEALRQGRSVAMVQSMVQLGRYEDDCGVLKGAPPLPDLRRPAASPAAAPPDRPDNMARLPAWPDEVRGVPNMALRSALFGAIRRGPRRYMERERIASVDGMDVFYTGQRLDQCDLDVWEAVLHFIRQQELGKECRFTAYAMLKMLGKADNGQNRDILHKQLLRLRANAVEVRNERFVYIGGLIDEAFKDEKTHEYVVVANSRIKVLFERDQFTQIDWAVRLELARHPLAQWLHGFYASHAKPYAYSVEKLHELCGSEAADLSDWKTKELRKSLDAVAHACEKHGQAFKSEIRGDLVHVDRQPSKSQRKHLVGKAKKPKTASPRKNAMAPVGDLLKPKK
jgi:TrfA protein